MRINGGGMEKFAGSQRAATGTAGYGIRYGLDVDPTWRVLDGDEIWDITAVYDGDGVRTETVLAVERLDPNQSVV